MAAFGDSTMGRGGVRFGEGVFISSGFGEELGVASPRRVRLLGRAQYDIVEDGVVFLGRLRGVDVVVLVQPSSRASVRFFHLIVGAVFPLSNRSRLCSFTASC